MPGPLEHAPSQVTAKLLVDLGLGAAPPAAPWPVYYDRQPDVPDECLAVFTTTGRKHGRSMKDGEVAELEAVLVRARARTAARAFAKLDAVAKALDVQVAQTYVAPEEGALYKVWAVHRESGPLDAGDEPGTKRALATLNLTLSLRQMDLD